MSHKLEGILALVRSYQLPLWLYSPHEEFNPYLLASLGFRPIARNLLQCHVCLKQVAITEQVEANPKQLLEMIRKHEESCLYFNEEPSKISREELYLSMDDISSEMDLNKPLNAFPLLNSTALHAFFAPNAFLLKKVLALYQINYQRFKITFMLKMLGWHLTKEEDGRECLTCYFCGRSLPLDKYTTVPEDKQDVELESTLPQEKLFNPVGEHRYFCLMAGKEENWLVHLQHQQNKFSESIFFKFKTSPLESQRMRLHIDKYIDSAKEKIEGGLNKLKTLTHQCGLLCSQLGEDRILGVQTQQQENELKRFRQHEQSVKLVVQHLSKELTHPLKKIKFT